MLKIWGRANSSNVMKVLWCADELRLPWERIDLAGAFGGTDTPEYRALNPNGVVPTVRDGDYVLWESNAIVRYLAAKYGAGTLWPNDPETRGVADAWMDWQQTELLTPLRTLFWTLVRTPPAERDPAVVERTRRQTADVLARLDQRLKVAPYVAGHSFTMGDIPAGAMVRRWFGFEIERPPLPHLEAWFQRLQERPAYREHVMVPMT